MRKKILALFSSGLVALLLLLPLNQPVPVQAQTDEGSTPPSSSTSDDEETADDETDSCESKAAPLGWMVCPVILALDQSFEFVDSQIADLLEVDDTRYNREEFKVAATNIRRIAFIILIPIMLVMVLGTALGFEVFSAYTVKKALPRLVVAVMFIALSFPILTFFIELIDAVGAGIFGLIVGPFSDSTTVGTLSLADLYGYAGIGGGLAQFMGNLALGIGIIIFLAFFLPVILMTAAIAFIVLMLRQTFIVGLLLLAPLAILAWIFPGNDKLWKTWWGAFSKLLFMFPIIMGILALGRVFAYLWAMDSARIEGAVIEPILMLIAYVAPYAFIPFTFKLAGGVFATLTGAINDREKGFFDRQRQKRAEKRERWSSGRAINPNRYSEGTFRRRMTDRLNSGASTLMDPVSSAKIAAGTTGGKALVGEINQAKWEHTQKLGESLSRVGMNDRALKVLSTGFEGKDGRTISAWDGSAKDLDRAIGEMDRYANDYEDGNMALAAKQLRDNGNYLTQVSRNDEYGRASIAGAAGLALASQGFADKDDIAQVANILDGPKAKFAGVGSMFKTQAELAGARAGALTKPGYSVELDDQGKFIAGDSRDIARIRGMGVQDIGSAKAPQLEKYHGSFVEALSRTGAGSDLTSEQSQEIDATLQQAYHSYNNPDIKAEIRKILGDAEVRKTETRMGRELNDTERDQVKNSVGRLLQRIDVGPNRDELARMQQTQQEQQEKQE